jgi:glycosyltransferase involved in cell wall biosynthesis
LRKAAFIKTGKFSHINDSVLNELKRNFYDYEFDVIDLMPAKYSMETAQALFYALIEYGKDIVFGKKTFIGTYNRTAYYVNRRRNLILEKLSREKYDFTFQTQSLFDASIPGIPHFLYTDHTHMANLAYPGFDCRLLLNKKWLDLEQNIYQNATINFTMSSNISKSIIEDYGISPDKVKCIYSGSNVEISKEETFDNSRFSKKNILFIGVDWHRKGGPLLAEAFKTVLATYPNATLTIVGCSPQLDLPNCSILGKVDLQKVKECYNQASVFCVPSIIEPFGIVFLEAMAHKLPVIATNIGAIPDFIHEGKNGHLVEPGNASQLSGALIKMLGSEDECRKFGEYGSTLFRKRYTWEKTGRRLRTHIQNAMVGAEVHSVTV